MPEVCQNPWKKCTNQDILLDIIHQDEKLPICHDCWTWIILNNKGCSDENEPFTIE